MDLLSPGITGDNPNFGLAIWSQGDNSQGYFGDQGYPVMDNTGYAPQGPMATPVRTGGPYVVDHQGGLGGTAHE